MVWTQNFRQEMMIVVDIEVEGACMDVNIMRPKFSMKSKHNNQI